MSSNYGFSTSIGNLQNRIGVLEDNYELVEIFESVTSTSGSVTVPTESTIRQGQYQGNNAVCVELSSGYPIDKPVTDASGVIVTVNLLSNGSYTLSSIPSNFPSPVAIVYQIETTSKYLSNVDPNSIVEYMTPANAINVYFNNAGTRLDAEDVQTAIDELDSAQLFNYYVSKSGNDSNDGKSLNKTFLTIQAALDEAQSQTPSSSNRFLITIVDAGSYTENLTVYSWCGVYGQGALIDGNHTVQDNSLLQSFRLVASSGTAITKSTGTATATIVCPRMVLSGSANGLLCTSGTVTYSGDSVEVENGFGIGSTSTSDIYASVNRTDIMGTGIGIGLGSTGSLEFNGGSIHDNGSGTAIYVALGGIVNAILACVDANTAYNVVDAGSTLNLHSARLAGAEINNGTLNLINGITGINITGSVSSAGLNSTVSGTTIGLNIINNGTGDSAKIGNNTIDYSSWNNSGELRCYGDATQWEDVNINPSQLYFGFGSNPDIINIPGTSLEVAAFSPTTEEEVSSGFEIPHAAKQGGVMNFHVHWSPTNTNTGVVRWGLEYAWFDESTAVTTSTTIYVNDTAGGTAWVRQTANFADITIPSMLGMNFSFRIFRDATDAADTYTGDAAITTTFGAHIELDSLGSNQILVKYQ